MMDLSIQATDNEPDIIHFTESFLPQWVQLDGPEPHPYSGVALDINNSIFHCPSTDCSWYLTVLHLVLHRQVAKVCLPPIRLWCFTVFHIQLVNVEGEWLKIWKYMIIHFFKASLCTERSSHLCIVMRRKLFKSRLTIMPPSTQQLLHGLFEPLCVTVSVEGSAERRQANGSYACFLLILPDLRKKPPQHLFINLSIFHYITCRRDTESPQGINPREVAETMPVNGWPS